VKEWWLLTMLAVPLILAAFQGAGRGRRMAGWLTPWAALPALLLVFSGTFMVEVPWMLLGSRLGVDPVGRVFLGLTAGLWLAAGLFARSYLAHDADRGRFQVFFLLTMAGNLGVTVAQDGASFLAFFTLMSLAAYGLIVHDRRPASLRAGRVYMVMTIAGEMLLFAGMILLAHETRTLDFEGLSARLAESPRRDAIVGLLLAGFGIKLGVMPLHVWLPLAHPAAPTPASAVLSGAIIKTGLLGLLRTLPLGAVALPGWGSLCLVLGLTTSLLAALIGITQRNPKTVLAYSSISQMGLVTVGLGAALAAPDAWPMISSLLLLWAVHHALAKAALFLGVGVAGAKTTSAWRRSLVAAGLLLAALALAGLPLTMGFAAKAALKDSAAAVEGWATGLAWLLPLTSVTTTLLVSRFLWLVWPSRRQGHGGVTAGMIVPWTVLSAGVVIGYFVLRWHGLVNADWVALDPAAVWAAVWPMFAAGVIVLLVIVRPQLAPVLAQIRVPEGDLVVVVAAAARWCRREWNQIDVVRLLRWFGDVQRMLRERLAPALPPRLDRVARALENDTSTGLFLALLAVTLFIVSLGL
jgi:formate hydrogenlyase subunit 3/multisubunit Na+/H+ antiporter MnhD subunit